MIKMAENTCEVGKVRIGKECYDEHWHPPLYSGGETPKAGDLIKLINNETLAADLGAKAVVREPIGKYREAGFGGLSKRFIGIKWVDERAHKQQDGGYDPSKFTLIERICGQMRRRNPKRSPIT